MSTEPASQPTSVDVGVLRRQTALHEFLELLVLRQRAAAAGVVGTIVLALLVTLVAPGVLTASAVTGVVVGLLALAVGIGAAFVVHHQDPVLRAPGQARWDGGSVLAWVASLHGADEVAPALAVLRERVGAAGRHRVLLLDGGGGARAAGGALGDAAAAAGIATLLIDLTDERPQPGMAAVGEGSARLVDAVEMDQDRQLARIGAGRRLLESVTATVDLLGRPSRDLELVLVVGPDDEDARASLVGAVDRAVVVVTAGSRQRTAVRDTLAGVGARSGAELLLVGGHLTDTAPTGRQPAPPPEASEPSGDDDGPPSIPPPPQVAVLSRHRAGVTPPPSPPSDAPSPSSRAAGPPAEAPPAPPAEAVDPPAPDARDLGDGPPRAWSAEPAPAPVPTHRPDHRAARSAASVRVSEGHVRVVSAVGPGPVGVQSDASSRPTPEPLPLPPAPTRPAVSEVDTSWQFRPFRGQQTDEVSVDDPVEDAATVAVHADEPDATAEIDAGDDALTPRSDPRRPGTIDLAEPRDLVTTATLEFLASSDWDDRP